MNKQTEALKLALEALEEIADEVFSPYDNKLGAAILAIREALAEQPAQQQEPVAVYVGETWCGSVVRLYEDLPLETPLYTSPPASKPWVGLTDEDKAAIYRQADEENWHDQPLLEAIEAKLREKNA